MNWWQNEKTRNLVLILVFFFGAFWGAWLFSSGTSLLEELEDVQTFCRTWVNEISPHLKKTPEGDR